MRAATVGAFALGFACGMASLAIVVGSRGWVHEQKVGAVNIQPVKPSTAAAPTPAAPEADRLIVEPGNLHLQMPLDGINPEKLADTFHDTRSGGRPHEALDIPAPRGTPVKAVADGAVVKLFYSKQGGITVYQFDRPEVYCYYYAHLDRYAEGLKEGMLLHAGDVLGYVGTTGNAPPNVPHLHFALFRLGPEKHWWQGTALDPLPFLRR